jgi:large subunit ribosomal protein L30
MTSKSMKVTQIRSGIGFDKKQSLALRGLGLRRINHTVEVEDTPSTRGLVLKVRHLVKVEPAATAAGRKRQINEALKAGDLTKLGEVSEASCLAMHANAMAARPGNVDRTDRQRNRPSSTSRDLAVS